MKTYAVLAATLLVVAAVGACQKKESTSPAPATSAPATPAAPTMAPAQSAEQAAPTTPAEPEKK